MNDSFFCIRSRRLLTEEGLRPACLLIRDGAVVSIVESNDVPAGIKIMDVGDLVVMPGLVDSHVHLNEPGRTEWEGFETGTAAAAAGGITTLADMPLNSQPVTTTLAAFQEKLAATKDKLAVDCAFYGGVIPGNSDSLIPLIKAGVSGFKCFLVHSGIDDFPNVTEFDLNLAMPVLASHRIPLLVHAELECTDQSKHPVGDADSQKQNQSQKWNDCSSYRQFLHSRPRHWENDAIDLMIKLGHEHNCPVHIVHLSSSDAISSIKRARAEGLHISVETCPHYLTFAAEEIADGDPRFKCAPPIREKENRDKLWNALIDGTIDFVVSDHSPCTPSLKFLDEGDLQKAWGGISSLQFVLPAVWTEASERGATINDLSRWLSIEPAKFLGLSGKKGSFVRGADADIVVWDPEGEFKVVPSIIEHRHKVTPYDGMRLKGKVEKTFVRGQLVYDGGRVLGNRIGKTVLRNRVESVK